MNIEHRYCRYSSVISTVGLPYPGNLLPGYPSGNTTGTRPETEVVSKLVNKDSIRPICSPWAMTPIIAEAYIILFNLIPI